MATKTRAKAKRKKTTVTKTASRRKTVRKTRMIRKKAAKKAPPRRAARTKANSTAKVAVKPTPVSQRHSLKQSSRRQAGLHSLQRRSSASAS